MLRTDVCDDRFHLWLLLPKLRSAFIDTSLFYSWYLPRSIIVEIMTADFFEFKILRSLAM